MKSSSTLDVDDRSGKGSEGAEEGEGDVTFNVLPHLDHLMPAEHGLPF